MDFKVYHLNKAVTPEQKKVYALLKRPYRKLDDTIIKEYVLTKMEEMAIRERPEQSYNDYMEIKCQLVESLLAKGAYELVAEVSLCKTPYDAIVKTNSINNRWHIVKNKGVKVVGQPTRDTTGYDIIEWNNEKYLYTTFGLINISERKYFEFES